MYTYDDLKKANQGYDISIYDVYWIDENDGSNGNGVFVTEIR